LVGKKDKISIKSFLNALNIAQKFSQEWLKPRKSLGKTFWPIIK
jgi:hypothetical protein